MAENVIELQPVAIDDGTMQKAIEENDWEKFKKLVENRKFKFLPIGNFLYYSISKSELFALELIKNNVELELKLNQRSNDDDRTPLMKACELGKTEIVQALLEKAKNNQDIAVNAQDQYGYSAWHFACDNGPGREDRAERIGLRAKIRAFRASYIIGKLRF